VQRSGVGIRDGRSIRLQHALTLRRAQLDRQEASEDLVRR
jgi:hypothetical protein